MKLMILAAAALALTGCMSVPKTNLAEMKMCSPSIGPASRASPIYPAQPRGCASNPFAQSDAIAIRNRSNQAQPHGEPPAS